MRKLWIMLLLIAGIGLFTIGCETTPAQEGAMWGGGAGAIAGQLIGGDTKSTLIGAGVGALGGAIINDAASKEKEKTREQAYNEGYNAGAAQSNSYNSTGYTTTQQPQYNTAPR